MQIVGRDQPDQELKVEFNREKCLWELTKAETQLFERPVDPLILKVAAFMEHYPIWSGTASQLLEQMQLTEVKPHALTRKLNVNVSVLFNKFRIKYWQGARTGEKRIFNLERIPEEIETSDAMTVNDANSDTTPAV